MEPEKLQTLQAENNQLEAKLTKRNEQYIFDLKKALKAANLTDEQTIVALNEMLPILVEEQKLGKPRVNYLEQFQSDWMQLLTNQLNRKNRLPHH